MRDQQATKGDRALKLYEQGVDSRAIAERLGMRDINAVHRLISQVKKRRAEKAGEVDA